LYDAVRAAALCIDSEDVGVEIFKETEFYLWTSSTPIAIVMEIQIMQLRL
jgi:hypothetical protein